MTVKTSLHLPRAHELISAGYREIGNSLAAWLCGLSAALWARWRARRKSGSHAAVAINATLGRNE